MRFMGLFLKNMPQIGLFSPIWDEIWCITVDKLNFNLPQKYKDEVKNPIKSQKYLRNPQKMGINLKNIPKIP